MKKFKKYLKIVISLALLILLISWIDFDQFLTSLEDANYWYLILVLLLIPVDRFIMAFKWNMLLKEKNIRISVWEALKIYYIGNFIGLFLPSTIGTDVIRASFVVKQKYDISDVIASILVERLMGIISLFIFGLFSAIILIKMTDNFYFSDNQVIYGTTAIILISLTLFILSLNSRISNIIIKFLYQFKNRKYLSKISTKVQKLVISYQTFSANKTTLILFFILTIVEIFIASFLNFLTGVALHVNVSLLYFLAFIPLLMIIGRLPISLDGFGIKEGGTLYFLALVGVPKALGFGVGVVSHILTWIGVIPGGILYMFDNSKKKIGTIVKENELKNNG